MRDGHAERVAIRIGARTPARTEILSGVAAGDEVILTPGIEPGQRVRAR